MVVLRMQNIACVYLYIKNLSKAKNCIKRSTKTDNTEEGENEGNKKKRKNSIENNFFLLTPSF